MTTQDPEEIDRIIRLLTMLRKHPGMWQGKGRVGEDVDVSQIADMIGEDPDDVLGERRLPEPTEVEKSAAGGREMKWKEAYPETPGKPALGSWEAEPTKHKAPDRPTKKMARVKKEIGKGELVPDIQKMLRGGGSESEDATGGGGIAAGGGSVLEDMPMTEEGPEGGHKCKLCGGECGDDKACDTKSCPNNREEGGAAETESSCKPGIKRPTMEDAGNGTIGDLVMYAGPVAIEALNSAAQQFGYGVADIRPESGDTWQVKVVGPGVPAEMWISVFIGDTPEEFANETFGQGFDPGAYMESKSMKKLRLLKESAKGRLSRRLHRLMDVASSGKILSEEEWKAKIGEENFGIANQIGLLQETEEKVLTEDGPPGGASVSEQPPLPGAEAPMPGGDEMVGGDEGLPPEMGGEEGEGEMEEEEEPITVLELAKVLEALRDRADEEANMMIDRAIADQEMGEEGEGMGGEEEGMGGEEEEGGGPPLGEEGDPGADAKEAEEEAEEDAEVSEEDIQEAEKKWGQEALKDADKPPAEGGTKGSLRKMMGKKEGEKVTRAELKAIIDSPTASKEKKSKASAIYNLGGGAKSEGRIVGEDAQINEIASVITEDL
jgi:hypothetical protein